MSGKPRYKHREIRFVSMVINNDSLGRLAEARKYLQWQMENYKPRSGVTPKTSPEGFEKAAGFIASQATYRAVGEYEIRVRFDYADAAGKHASVTTCDTIEVVKGRDYIELHKESSLPLQPGPDD